MEVLAVFLLKLKIFICNCIKSFLPSDSHELTWVSTSSVYSLHGIKNSLRALHEWSKCVEIRFSSTLKSPCNQIFLSHMGEMNLKLAAKKPLLIEMPFSFTGVQNPAALAGRFRAGEAVLVNLSPSADGGYTLIVAPVVMQDVPGVDKMVDAVRGWFKPSLPIADFLSQYSRAGGTHHSALVYGKVSDEIVRWGKLMQWRSVVLA